MSTDSIAAEDFKNSSVLSQFIYDQNNLAEFSDSNSVGHEGEYHERSEIFSDLVLEYINQMLMEEDVDDKYVMLLGHPDLEATEKPFYDLIGEKYPLSPEQPPSLYSSLRPQSPDSRRSYDSNSSGINFFQSNSEFAEYQNLEIFPSSHPSSCLGLPEDQFADLFFKNFSASEFKRGVEEAKKFLPSEVKLDANVGETCQTAPNKPAQRARRQKNRHSDEFANEEVRRSKQSAFSYEEPVASPLMFDDVLLCTGDKFPTVVKAIREKLYNEANKNFKNAGGPKEQSVGRKSRSKKQPKEKDETDTHTFLLHCAQAMASGDYLRANDLLKQIRQYSSPHGDASQRVAHYFADGLEARLAGTGSEVYRSLVSKRKTVCDVLKAYQLYLASCPFKKISYHFANQTILDSIQDSPRVHILDLGIYFGFQWPIFLKLLSSRPGGPPKLRITGIDIPQPGFRPAERIEETGRWLSEYAERFGIPFKYHGIAAKFDEISIKELRIKEGETLVVNCLFRMHSPADETVLEDCPRDKVLDTIRKLSPAVFVNVVVNGSYGAPLFMTRFREALYHFSAVFDMLDATTPRESERRLLVERDLYGGMLINAVSCEGMERERPETYKQWQVRCSRAGFELQPICGEFVRKLEDGVRSIYHKDFNMDEDGRWLLVGWKGRILYALSAWKPWPY